MNELTLEQLGYKTEFKTVLNNLNCHIKSGTYCFSGQSGEGKGLLWSMLSGLTKPTDGDIKFNQVSIFTCSPKQLLTYRKKVACIFQSSALISNLTIKENLELPINLHCRTLSSTEKQNKIYVMMEEFGGISWLDQRPHLLSKAQLALVNLCRSLLCEPDIILWDEPQLSIDDATTKTLLSKMKALKKSGTTLVLFSNEKQKLGDVVDCFYRLENGSLVS